MRFDIAGRLRSGIAKGVFTGFGLSRRWYLIAAFLWCGGLLLAGTAVQALSLDTGRAARDNLRFQGTLSGTVHVSVAGDYLLWLETPVEIGPASVDSTQLLRLMSVGGGAAGKPHQVESMITTYRTRVEGIETGAQLIGGVTLKPGDYQLKLNAPKLNRSRLALGPAFDGDHLHHDGIRYGLGVAGAGVLLLALTLATRRRAAAVFEGAALGGGGAKFIALAIVPCLMVPLLGLVSDGGSGGLLGSASWLSSVMPATGDSTLRYALSMTTLLLILPGGLMLLATRLRGRIAVLLTGVAVALVPALVLISLGAFTLPIVRLPS